MIDEFPLEDSASEQSEQEQEETPAAISFGDVVSTPPQQGTAETGPSTPDANGHLAVAEVQSPKVGKFAPTKVFVALDAMLDMQEHAAEDTSVELGGILVGRRGTKDDGTPFVVIEDSLRARHYRATRGSFTFTHETWADLNAQRAELPDETEIVGWYHTHPGWSVFLSDMDVFICDHFFQHPDDVALVIDPTNGDTGLFVRRNAENDRAPRRLDHYFLHCHRRRTEDLVQWSQYFSGGLVMSQPASVFPGRQSTPMVVQAPPRPEGIQDRLMPTILIALLGFQLLLTGILVLQLVAPDKVGTADSVAPSGIAAREAVVDSIMERIIADDTAGIKNSYRELAMERESLRAANLGLITQIDTLTDEAKRNEVALARSKTRLSETQKSLSNAEAKLAKIDSSDAETPWQLFGLDLYACLIGGCIGAVLAGGAVYGVTLKQKSELESQDA